VIGDAKREQNRKVLVITCTCQFTWASILCSILSIASFRRRRESVAGHDY